MSSIVEQIQSRLAGSAGVTTIATGGIWKRPIKREGPGATPEAFYPQPPYQPMPAIYVSDGGDQPAVNGVRSAFFGFPTLWFYAPAHDNGRAAISALWLAAYSALIGFNLALPNGTGATIERVAGRVGIQDAPDLERAVMDTMRLQVTGLYVNEG